MGDIIRVNPVLEKCGICDRQPSTAVWEYVDSDGEGFFRCITCKHDFNEESLEIAPF